MTLIVVCICEKCTFKKQNRKVELLLTLYTRGPTRGPPVDTLVDPPLDAPVDAPVVRGPFSVSSAVEADGASHVM